MVFFGCVLISSSFTAYLPPKYFLVCKSMEIFLDLSLQQECEVSMVFILFHQVSVMLHTEMWGVFFPSLCYCFAFRLQNNAKCPKYQEKVTSLLSW